MPNTVISHLAALAEPLQLAFGVDVTLAPFHKLSHAFFHLWPAHALPAPSWSLDRVLAFLSPPRFVKAPSVQDCFLNYSFLLALASWGSVQVFLPFAQSPNW